MQELLDVGEAVVEGLGHPGQSIRCGAQALAVIGHERLYQTDRVGEILHSGADLVRVVGQRAGHRGQVLVQRPHHIGAVLQCRDQDRQVLDRGEDIGAVVTDGRNRLGQFDQGGANVGALAAQVVRGGVDEGTEFADPAGLGGLQRLGDAVQLFADIVVLDRHHGAVLVDHGVVLQHRTTGVGRGQLDCPRRHQHRREDRRIDVGGHLVACVVPERDLDPFGLRLDLVDPPDRHAEDHDVIALEDAVAAVEVGDDVDPVDGVADLDHH